MPAHDPLFPAIFIDRDGVIIHNRAQYVRSLRHVIFYPRSLQALELLAKSRYKVVIVTNQAAIGRGLVAPETANEINCAVVQAIEEAGGRVDGLYVCPHAPADHCTCRKPQPGLLLRAAEELGIDLAASYMIGDALSDVEAGQRAGVRQAVLVLSGRGRAQRRQAQGAGLAPFAVSRSLLDGVKMILHGM